MKRGLLLLAVMPIAFSILCFAYTQNGQTINNATEQAPRTRIVMLGTGTPNAEPGRMGSCVAIVVDAQPYLIDIGAGLVNRANAAVEKGVSGLTPKNLNIAFVTHLHSDHTVGFPDLILTPWVLEREAPLQVYGPPGLKSMSEHLLKAYEQDIASRIFGLEPANRTGYQVEAHEFTEGGVVYRDENVTVKAFEVKHGAWPYAFGYRFETPDRVIVISGDTVYSESLIAAAKGCDVLIHEVYSQAGWEKRDAFWQRYHKEHHTSSVDLGKLAAQVKPELLILYHCLYWGATEETMLEEVGRNFKGKTVIGKDLDIY
jgi:ribonuclease BN (tRNA processing enzyme)